MAYSFCPFCDAVIADPAGRFCPSCGGRLPETPATEQPVAQPSGLLKDIPHLIFATGLFLVLVIAAILVQVFALHFIPIPVAVDGSIQTSPSITPEVPRTTETTTTPAQPSMNLNTAGSGPGPKPPVNTTITTPAPSNTPTFTGPVITITGTSPYRYQAPARGSSPQVPVINTTSLAARVHELVNKVRLENGRPVLGTDVRLEAIARAHSSDMAAHGYFGHVNLLEMDPTARGAAAGYTCHKDDETYYTYGIAENLFATYRYGSVLFRGNGAVDHDWKTEEAVAEETVDAWMNSLDHRGNILANGVDREGIGVAISMDDLVFVTEDFC
jgi:uncharacterized protein YkwD